MRQKIIRVGTVEGTEIKSSILVQWGTRRVKQNQVEMRDGKGGGIVL